MNAFYEFVIGLNNREREILTDRLGYRPIRTLDDIGKYFSVTRERIRQIESQLLRRLDIFVEQNLDEYIPANPWVGRYESALTKFPKLSDSVDGINAIDLFFASQMVKPLLNDDLFEKWLVIREADLKIELSPERTIQDFMTSRKITSFSNQEFTEWWQKLDVEGEALFEVLKMFDLEFGVNNVRKAPKTLLQKLLAIFEDANGSLALQEIEELIGEEWTLRSAINLMSTDQRFMLVDRGKYALSEWGLREYRGIKEEIVSLIEDQGPLPLKDVVEIISDWFPNLSQSSIRTYSNTHPLVVTAGVVELRLQSVDVHLTLNEMTPRQLKNFYSHDDGFCVRIEINRDHLRGSGFPCSRAIGAVLGVPIGQTWSRTLKNSSKILNFYNRPPQAAFGSIRSTLMDLDAEEGDQVFIKFYGAEGRIEEVGISILRRSMQPSNHEDFAIQLVGLLPHQMEARQNIAKALNLAGDSTWKEIENTADARGDVLLARSARLIQIEL